MGFIRVGDLNLRCSTVAFRAWGLGYMALKPKFAVIPGAMPRHSTVKIRWPDLSARDFRRRFRSPLRGLWDLVT